MLWALQRSPLATACQFHEDLTIISCTCGCMKDHYKKPTVRPVALGGPAAAVDAFLRRPSDDET
jgi:hypothetical protein